MKKIIYQDKLIAIIVFSIIFISISSCNKEELPIVSTAEISDILSNSAKCGGNVSDDGNQFVMQRGVCWSTSSNPTIDNQHSIDGSDVGSFVSSISGLVDGTTYYVRAYATNIVGTAYGEEKVFIAGFDPSNPEDYVQVTTNNVSNISSTSATCGGNVKAYGGATVTARGVCWSTSQNPTIANSHTTDGNGTGSFTSSITGLTAGNTYYVRAYAVSSNGTSYGEIIRFITPYKGTWVRKSTFPGNRRNIGAVSISCNGKGYFGGGAAGVSTQLYDFYEYNPTTNSWTQKANVPFDWAYNGFTINGNIYYSARSYGGSGNPYVYEYNPSSNTWTRKCILPENIFIRGSFGIGNKGYFNDGGTLYEYNPATNVITQKGSFGSSDQHYPIAFSIGTKGYVGGAQYSYNNNVFFEYSSSTNTFTQKANYPRCGVEFSFAIGNKGYAGGGYSYGGGGYYYDVWEYGPTTNVWQRVADLPNYSDAYEFEQFCFTIDNNAYIYTSENIFYMFTP